MERGPGHTPPVPPRRAPVFVGRRQELTELLAGLEDALEGHGRLFLLAGEAGIGKSRLADELATTARELGAMVLWGRCWEAGGAPAYWPWVQSIRSYFRNAGPQTVRSQMAAGAADIVQMLPEVRGLFPDLPRAPAVDPEAARFRLFDAVTSFLRSAAEAQPLVLVIDDLHVADTPSLLFLDFLAGELAESRILAVAAFRDTDLTREHPLTATVGELLRHRVTSRLPLLGLTESDVARFIVLTTGVAPPTTLAAAIHAETDGNPLFVGEVVRLLAAEGRLERPGDARSLAVPRGVRDVIARRLARLSGACNELLTLASVLGREFDLPALERLSGQASGAALWVLEEAVGARVIGEVPGTLGRLRFSHALVRDTLYDDIPPARRAELHRLAGEALEALYAIDPDWHLAELAHHFVRAAPGGNVDRAVGYARRGGDRAVRLLAYEEAVRLYELALQALGLKGVEDEDTRCELLLALGDAQARTGDEPGAKRSFLRAAGIAERLHASELLARASLGYGGRFVWARAGTDQRIVSLLQQALAALEARDSPLRARVMARLAGALRDQPAREPRATLSQAALEMARRLGDPATLAYTLDGRCAVLLWPENPEERVAMATELARVGEEIGDGEKLVQGRYYRLMALLELGDLRAVRAELEVIDGLAGELGQRPQRWLVEVTRATLALFEGRLDEAERLIPRALALGERAQRSDAILSYRTQRFTLARHRGSLEEVEPLIRRAVEEYPARPMFRCMLTQVHAETGRTEDARRRLEELAANGFEALPRSNEWLFSMGMLAEVAELIGDPGPARTMYDLLVPFGRYNAATADYISMGAVSRYLGLLALTLARPDDALRHLEEALDANQRMGARPWATHTRCDLARALLARDGPGDRELAEELLGETLRACKELQMNALETRAAGLLEGAAAGPLLPAAVGSAAARGRPSVFRAEGDYWSIAYEGDAFRLRDLKGLHYIARLLAAPGREVHALDLSTGERGVRTPGRRPEPGQELREPRDVGEVLDATGRTAYRRRLRDLEEEIEEARAFGDAERAARAQEECDLVAEELARALGLGGRGRRTGHPAERARVAVTRAIRTALAGIREHSPALAAHLDRTIRTGSFCSYNPDPRAPISWHV
jgi:tetratricopeptide (TPR) repeat protein